jgi:hypothetical protein
MWVPTDAAPQGNGYINGANDEEQDMTYFTPIMVNAIRRDMELNPSGRGGVVTFQPSVAGHGKSGCPGDNLAHDFDEAEKRMLTVDEARRVVELIEYYEVDEADRALFAKIKAAAE